MTAVRSRLLVVALVLAAVAGLIAIALPDHHTTHASVGTEGPAPTTTWQVGDEPLTTGTTPTPVTTSAATTEDGPMVTTTVDSTTTSTARPGATTTLPPHTTTTLHPAPTGPHDLRGRIVFEDFSTGANAIMSVLPDGSGLRREVGCPGLTRGPAEPDLSPDGTEILLVSADPTADPLEQLAPHGLTAVRVDGSGSRTISSEVPMFTAPRWSPDGRTVAVPIYSWSHDDQVGIDLVLIGPDGHLRMFDIGDEDLTAVSWSADGSHLALLGGSLWTFDVASGTATRVAGGSGRAVAWDPSGDWIYVTEDQEYGDNRIERVHPDGGSPDVVVTAPDLNDDVLGFTPDGSRLLYRVHGDVLTAAPDGSDPRTLWKYPS